MRKYDVLTKYERAAIGADFRNYKKCAKCGKQFYCTNRTQRDYVYKIKRYGKTKFFCSWSCMRKYERK